MDNRDALGEAIDDAVARLTEVRAALVGGRPRGAGALERTGGRRSREAEAVSDCVHVAPGDPQSRWAVRVPGSKSITNRALLLAGVASGQSVLLDPLVADDTHSMAAALRTLGVGIAERTDAGGRLRWVVEGLGGAPTGPEEVYCGMGATVGASWFRCSQPDAAASPWTRTRSFGAARSARCSRRCARRAPRSTVRLSRW